MAYLHGVETFEIANGQNPVSVAETAIIALIGIAPQGAINTPTLVASRQDAEQFGGELYPMTINRSLQSIFKQTSAKVIVINVFNPATMKTSVVDEAVTVTLGSATLDSTILLLPTPPVVKDNAAAVTYVLDTDYTIDEYGKITIIPGGDIAEGDTIKVSYDKPDILGLAAADFIGVAGPPKTGMKLLDLSKDTFGFNPKIIICPDYSKLEAVAIEMEAQCQAFRAICYVDETSGTSRSTLIANRTTSGKSFNSTSERLVPCGPWVKMYNHKGVLSNLPLSALAAGLTAKKDNEQGYWVSPSNQNISGISGPDFAMAGSGISDLTSDANLLNAAGIMTMFKVGTHRLWGNRNASFPNSASAKSFIPVRRTFDVVHESLEIASIQFMDQPIIQATIDSIRATGNGFIRDLIQRGALVPGSKLIYDPADNSAAELALGHLTFQLIIMPPTPAERITYLSVMDITLLTNIS